MNAALRNVSQAAYFADVDRRRRTQNVEIRDQLRPDVVLDEQAVNEFIEAKYLIWEIRGAVQVRVQRTGPGNAVLGCVFLGPGR